MTFQPVWFIVQIYNLLLSIVIHGSLLESIKQGLFLFLYYYSMVFINYRQQNSIPYDIPYDANL